jgi:hypothetical protein
VLIAFTIAAVLAALGLALAPSAIRRAADAATASRASGAGFVVGWFVASLLLIGVSVAIACIIPATAGVSARVTVAVGLLVLGIAAVVVAPVSARTAKVGSAGSGGSAGPGERTLSRAMLAGAAEVVADPASVLLGVLAGLAAVGWFGRWWVTVLVAVALAVIASLAVLAAWLLVTVAEGRAVASACRVLQTRAGLLRLLAVAVAGIAGIIVGVLLLTA